MHQPTPFCPLSSARPTPRSLLAARFGLKDHHGARALEVVRGGAPSSQSPRRRRKRIKPPCRSSIQCSGRCHCRPCSCSPVYTPGACSSALLAARAFGGIPRHDTRAAQACTQSRKISQRAHAAQHVPLTTPRAAKTRPPAQDGVGQAAARLQRRPRWRRSRARTAVRQHMRMAARKRASED